MPSRISQNALKVGNLLVAEPFLNDVNFKRSVILLCHHDNEGSFGFVLNNKMESLQFNRLVPDFPPFEASVFSGGPVEKHSLHFIHNVGDLLEGSIRISSGVYFGGDLDNLKFLIESKLIEPKHIRFYLGYTGWEESQLHREFIKGTWIPAPMHANYIFKSQPNTLWQSVLKQKSDAFAIIADMPDTFYDN